MRKHRIKHAISCNISNLDAKRSARVKRVCTYLLVICAIGWLLLIPIFGFWHITKENLAQDGGYLARQLEIISASNLRLKHTFNKDYDVKFNWAKSSWESYSSLSAKAGDLLRLNHKLCSINRISLTPNNGSITLLATSVNAMNQCVMAMRALHGVKQLSIKSEDVVKSAYYARIDLEFT